MARPAKQAERATAAGIAADRAAAEAAGSAASFERFPAGEAVTVEPRDFTEYENNIKYYFNEYCREYKIDDMRKEKQLVFNGAMMYIHRRYIVPSGILRSKPYNNINNSVNNTMSNCNDYDIDVLYNIYIILKELANIYDKIASIPAFKTLTGITNASLCDWRNAEVLNCSASYRRKKAFVDWLTASEEDELKEFNLRNALGATERLNVDHGRREVKGVVSVTGGAELSAAILPKLSENRAQLAIAGQVQD